MNFETRDQSKWWPSSGFLNIFFLLLLRKMHVQVLYTCHFCGCRGGSIFRTKSLSIRNVYEVDNWAAQVGGIVISNHPATRKGRYVRAATVSSLQYSDAVKYPILEKRFRIPAMCYLR